MSVETPTTMFFRIKNILEHSAIHENEPTCSLEHIKDDLHHIMKHLKDVRSDLRYVNLIPEHFIQLDNYVSEIIGKVDDLQDAIIIAMHTNTMSQDVDNLMSNHRAHIHDAYHRALTHISSLMNVGKPLVVDSYQEFLKIS